MELSDTGFETSENLRSYQTQAEVILKQMKEEASDPEKIAILKDALSFGRNWYGHGI
jgi:hypothetical protein